MKTALLRSLLVLFFMLLVHTANVEPDAEPETFQGYIKMYSPRFMNDEQKKYRENVFTTNLKDIKKHNADPSNTYEQGVNKFSLLTRKEFQKIYLTRNAKRGTNPAWYLPNAPYYTPKATSNQVKINWRNDSNLPKNQGNCGSCWIFAAIGVLEHRQFQLRKRWFDLSQQDILDCNADGYGCDGGYEQAALYYVKTNGGVSNEADYKYTQVKRSCRRNKTKYTFKPSFSQYHYQFVTPNAASLERAVNDKVVGVAIDASNSWQSYKSGIYNSACSITQLNHAVVLMGYDKSVSGQHHWIVKNSWGTNWGEKGYIRMIYGNTCGITAEAYVDGML